MTAATRTAPSLGHQSFPSHPAVPVPAQARMLFALLSRLSSGRLRVTGPGGFVAEFGADDSPAAHIEIRDWDICSDVLEGGDIAFGEAYIDGRWDTPDLVHLLSVVARNQRALDQAFYGSALRRITARFLHLLRSNTRRGARRNIEAHYDLGNDFYRLWLDPTMTYSSALFDDQATSLEDGQRNKYRRVVRELALEPGAHVLEIGCGWGGFAAEVLRNEGTKLTGLSLSPAQLHYANARLGDHAGSGRVDLALRDYRDEAGRYDAVASIEMYEAVGERYWPVYFSTIARVLKPAGRAVIQAITIDEDRFERYRASSDFIQRYVFPGGMLATVERIREEAARAGLALESQHRFGADYARTLEIWLQRFDAVESDVKTLGFDMRFIRLWRFYLAYCAAGFHAGSTDVGQYTFVRA